MIFFRETFFFLLENDKIHFKHSPHPLISKSLRVWGKLRIPYPSNFFRELFFGAHFGNQNFLPSFIHSDEELQAA